MAVNYEVAPIYPFSGREATARSRCGCLNPHLQNSECMAPGMAFLVYCNFSETMIKKKMIQ